MSKIPPNFDFIPEDETSLKRFAVMLQRIWRILSLNNFVNNSRSVDDIVITWTGTQFDIYVNNVRKGSITLGP